MPKQTQTIQTDTTAENTPFNALTLAPKIVTQLRQKLLDYQRNHARIKELEAAQDVLKAEIGTIREATGELSLTLDGFTVTLVAPTRATLNKKTLIALGCSPAWLIDATDIIPTKSYDLITLPGQKGHRKDEGE